jgi:uncharacterized LabA/DUF88 family protein
VESPRPRTRVYIDGFNFYYAAFRRGAFADHKWLDLVRFCEKALPANDIELVRFFTARLDPSRGRAGQRSRQDAYLEALATLPRLTIHFGEFVEHAKRQRLVRAPAGGPRTAEVWVPEEKGSDVNLASHLLLDAFRGAFDVAVVISNDADLLEPVRMVREELGRTVGVLKVEGGQKRCIFSGRADFIRTVRRGHFAAAQLPDELTDSHGRRISKPREW